MNFETANVGSENSDLEKEKPVNPSERRVYELESGEKIEVLAREFSAPGFVAPERSDGETEEDETQNVVFLPGWAMNADSAAIQKLSQEFADRSQGRTFTMSTHTEGMLGEDALLKEAEAIRRFIKEKNLKNIVLAGHSQGGDKAIDLATLLQDDPEMTVRGLILLDSMGIYEQKPGDLAKGFAKDSMVHTALTMTKNVVKNPEAVGRSLQAGGSVVSGIFRELRQSGPQAIKRTQEEVKTMAKANPRLSQVRVPVVLISGSKDFISNPEKIVPPEEEAKAIEEWKQKDAEAGTSTYIDPREEVLKKNVFPDSPYIRMIAPEKLGHHGVPVFRSESVANASLYMLKRFERRQKNEREGQETISVEPEVKQTIAHVENTLGPLSEEIKKVIEENTPRPEDE